MSASVQAVVAAVSAIRAPISSSEYDLHALVAGALASGGFSPRHEYPLGPRSRIDFLVDEIGVEVKRGKPASSVLAAQCGRYLASPELSALVVIVEKSVFLPGRIAGKPVFVVSLNRLWGITLP